MTRIALVALFVLSLAPELYGQAAPYNPYAPQVEDTTPVAADGKLNWPKFFKSAALEARFQSYFQMGSCVGTRKAINDRLGNNKVDINALGEAKLSGVATAGDSGLITMLDSNGHSIAVVAHPAGVTKIHVTGDMPLQQLRPGMTVRFQAKVDSSGVEHEPVTALEVITPSKDTSVPEVTADKLQTIVGLVTRVHNNRISLKVPTGKIRRLSLLVDAKTQVNVEGSSLDLVASGDHVEAFGHVYAGEGVNAERSVFASEITVLKGPPQSNGVTKTAAK